METTKNTNDSNPVEGKIKFGNTSTPKQADLIEAVGAEPSVYDNPIYETEISEFNFSVRTNNCFSSANIHNLRDLVTYNPAKLITLKGFGNRCLLEVQTQLKSLDLPIKPRLLSPKFLITESEAEKLLARNLAPKPLPTGFLSVLHDKRIISKIFHLLEEGLPLDNAISLNENTFVNWNEVSRYIEKHNNVAYKAPLYMKDIELSIDPNNDPADQIGFVVVTKEDIFNVLGGNNVRVSQGVLEIVVVKVVNELLELSNQLNSAMA